MKRAWYLWTWSGDAHLVPEVIGAIKSHHQEDEVIVIGDGTVDLVWPNVKTAQIDSPKWLSHGDSFLHERYALLLNLSTAEQFIKVDPDSEVRRPISTPKADWFGQLFYQPLLGTAGCGMGLSRKAIQDFVACPIESTDYRYTTVDGRELFAEDPTPAYYLTKCGYSPEPWLNIKLGRVFVLAFERGDWSITHPTIRKRMPAQMFSRIVIDDRAPIKSLEELGMALGSAKWRGLVYSSYGRALPGFQNVHFSISEGTPIPHARMAHQVIRMDSLGLLWLGAHCLGKADSIIQSWCSKEVAECRVQMMKASRRASVSNSLKD